MDRGRAHPFELGGDEGLDVLAGDRVQLGRHTGAFEERDEQLDGVQVGAGRPGDRLHAASAISKLSASRPLVPTSVDVAVVAMISPCPLAAHYALCMAAA